MDMDHDVKAPKILTTQQIGDLYERLQKLEWRSELARLKANDAVKQSFRIREESERPDDVSNGLPRAS